LQASICLNLASIVTAAHSYPESNKGGRNPGWFLPIPPLDERFGPPAAGNCGLSGIFGVANKMSAPRAGRKNQAGKNR
ncbi:MAG TPA: hypothetical protein VN678_06450, partial [Acidobacteriaceae bacterium]|nr:hypothetical protein [Acidobacteriaceae bacterium]